MKFSDLTTKSGLPADEVISALQKEIRRGHFEEASFLAIELLESGDSFVDKFWERILVISVEDVADHSAVPIVRALKDNFDDLSSAKKWDQQMQAIKAVQVLCEAKKDRLVSEIYDYIAIQRKEGHTIQIPEYAIDMHTKRGKENGCDYLHFLDVGAKIENQKEQKIKKYIDFLRKHHSS